MTSPENLFENSAERKNPPGGGPFARRLRWLVPYSPLWGCSELAALPATKIPRRSAPPNFQTGSYRRGGERRSKLDVLASCGVAASGYIRPMKDWVLITGASQGIGYEFAKIFAADGFPLILTARDEPRLQQIAAELTARHKIEIKVLPADLSRPNTSAEIFAELQRAQIHVGILVNNAGFGFHGAFADLDWPKQAGMVQVNITALAELTHLFLKPMLARREGRILNVASTAAFVPGPFMAMYYASKAFVQSFSQALSEELAGIGVTVTSVCPGMTRSQFQSRSGLQRQESFPMMEADVVARIGYRALMRGQRVVITGSMNRVFVFLTRFVPTRLVAGTVARFNRPKS
jgi:short-subunit dehydrogenase